MSHTACCPGTVLSQPTSLGQGPQPNLPTSPDPPLSAFRQEVANAWEAKRDDIFAKEMQESSLCEPVADAQYRGSGYAERYSNGPSATESLEAWEKRAGPTAPSGRGDSATRLTVMLGQPEIPGLLLAPLASNVLKGRCARGPGMTSSRRSGRDGESQPAVYVCPLNCKRD